MQHLTVLVHLIETRSLNPLPLVGKLILQPGKETTLYQQITNKAYLTDADAARDLYGCGPDTPAYQMLKSRLRQKLLNHLLFLDFSRDGISPMQKAEMDVTSRLHQAKVLLHCGKFSLGQKLLTGTLSEARHWELTAQVLDCLKMLRQVYSHTGNRAAFDKNEPLLNQYSAILTIETEAEAALLRARMELNGPVKRRRQYLPQLDAVLQRLKEGWEETGSGNLFRWYTELYLEKQLFAGNSAEVAVLTEEADLMAAALKIHPEHLRQALGTLQCLRACIRSGEYEQALQLAGQYLPSIAPSHPGWFVWMENYLIAALHTRRYTLAGQLLQAVDANAHGHSLSPAIRERWVLYRTFLHFLYPDALLPVPASFHSLIAAVPHCTKDKYGFNVSVLILQFLYYLKANQTESLPALADNLGQYLRYHFSDATKSRTIIFLQLLRRLVQADFDRNQWEQLHSSEYIQLSRCPVPDNPLAEVEMIPYEHLWEYIGQTLLAHSSGYATNPGMHNSLFCPLS
jgi:hypothetical protein